MKKRYWILAIATFLILLFFYYRTNVTNKIIYVNNFELFDKFKMKSDLDKQLQKDLLPSSNQLDSTARLIELYSKLNVDNSKIDSLKQYYLLLKNDFDKQFQEISKKYTENVNSKLNTFLEAYSIENDIQLIIGNGGQGSTLYVNKEIDWTKKVIEYVNKMYR
jgi:Skp family chaperone for outer membrane proteins